MYCTLVLMAPTAFTSFVIKDTVSPLLYTKDIIVIDLNEAVQSHFKFVIFFFYIRWKCKHISQVVFLFRGTLYMFLSFQYIVTSLNYYLPNVKCLEIKNDKCVSLFFFFYFTLKKSFLSWKTLYAYIFF